MAVPRAAQLQPARPCRSLSLHRAWEAGTQARAAATLHSGQQPEARQRPRLQQGGAAS